MSLFGKVLDIFGPGGSNNSFYARDFRNAYTFRPDQNPPRQKFQGYVNFVLNRSLYGSSFYSGDGSAFRVNISSLVKTATLPEMQFKTDTKNSYNRKKIINTGVEYEPVDIKVFDTINNDWLVLFMKYFSYHYMNPRNKSSTGREVGDDPTKATPGSNMIGSKFGFGGNWDSNAYGYNLNQVSNFFERIDYVLYHGNKGIQYSLMNPVLTRFRTGEIDYSSSEVMDFDMTFEYESFTIYDHVHFGLSEVDVARFEDAKGYSGPAFVPLRKPLVLGEDSDIIGKPLKILADDRERAAQPQAAPTAPAEAATDPSSAGAVNGSDLQSDQAKSPTSSDVNKTSDQNSQTYSDYVGGLSGEAKLDAQRKGSAAIDQLVAQGWDRKDAAKQVYQDKKDWASAAAGANNPTSNLKNNQSTLPPVYGKTASFATPPAKKKGFFEDILGKVADSALTAAIHGGSIKNAVINTAAAGTISGIVGAVTAPVRPSASQPKESPRAGGEKPPVTPTTEGSP